MSTGNTELRNQTGLFGARFDEGAEQIDDIDFKMVTFSLSGKDYGIDIMKVAEISKFDHFTFVPNTPPFVAGVYNLRGDIISVIDMRIMFNLPVPERAEDEVAEGLILRLENGLIGVIVDSIAKVVGISSDSIQPPHPIFADINLKYISGVVEHDERLYIMLDVERILGEEREEAPVEEDSATLIPPIVGPDEPGGGSQAADFIAQTLTALRGFHLTDLNRAW
ncbi:MAG: chemotaxis protein CheW, partial [Spirochaetales bacterium]